MQVMADAGLLQATTADIATRAKIAHGTVFAHFQTREDLLYAVIEELGVQVTARLHELSADDHGLQELLEAHIQGLAENERLYARLVAARSSIPLRAQSTLIMIQSAVAFHLGAALERECRPGQLAQGPARQKGSGSERPLHLLFNTWVGLLHHYLLHADLFAPGEPSVLKRYGPTLTRYFCELVARERSV